MFPSVHVYIGSIKLPSFHLCGNKFSNVLENLLGKKTVNNLSDCFFINPMKYLAADW